MTVNVSELPYLVSIVITNYNNANFVKDALESAVKQSYKNKEIIVIDDGSTDNSVSIINKFINDNPDYNIKLIEKPNGGTASARNEGVRNAKGEFIAFLDADDVYFPDKVAVSVAKLSELPGFGLAYTDYITVNTVNNVSKREVKPPFNATKLLESCIVSTNSVIKKEVFDVLGLFNENIKGMEDYEMWLRISLKYCMVHIPFPMFYYREHGKNKSLVTKRDEWIKEETQMKQDFINKYLSKK